MIFMALLAWVVQTKAREGFVRGMLQTAGSSRKNPFALVAHPFLQDSALPFTQVLTAEAIEQAFAQNQALFGQRDIFSTPVVLWAFLAQVLRDGKGAACAAAVADIAVYLQQTGQRVPSGDTGDYCRARAKLSRAALHALVGQTARQLDEAACEDWRWRGLRARLVDAFTFTRPDTPENQQQFPQAKSQRPGLGLPIARAGAVLSLATGAIHDLALGPYQGQKTGQTALLREILDGFQDGEVVVFDRYFCSFMMLALLSLRGVHVCTRLHQRRDSDFRRGRRLGDHDHLVTWTRPQRPAWMSPDWYEQIPLTLTLREMQFRVVAPGRRTETITVITTLTDPTAYPQADIAALYGFRWNAALDLRDIKQTLSLDQVRCKTPARVQLELWTTLLAYNLIRKVIATSAAVHGKQPRQLGFTLACQTILSLWMLLSAGACRHVRQSWDSALERIASHEVGNRPGRIEPRALKRRRRRYPLLTSARQELRQNLCTT